MLDLSFIPNLPLIRIHSLGTARPEGWRSRSHNKEGFGQAKMQEESFPKAVQPAIIYPCTCVNHGSCGHLTCGQRRQRRRSVEYIFFLLCLKDVNILIFLPTGKTFVKSRAGQKTRLDGFVAIGDYNGQVGLARKWSKEWPPHSEALILAKLSFVPAGF